MSGERSREQVEVTLRTLQWVNPIAGLLFVVCAVVGFWFTAAVAAVVTLAGVVGYGMATRELATHTTEDPR
jgi:hypothetical protein